MSDNEAEEPKRKENNRREAEALMEMSGFKPLPAGGDEFTELIRRQARLFVEQRMAERQKVRDTTDKQS